MDRIEKLNNMLSQHPGDPFLQHALALEHIKAGNDGEAKQLFTNILDNDPDYVGSYYHLALLLIRQGESQQAIRWCEQGLAACKRVGDQHAFRELNTVYEDLIY
ncbi:MAG TPA: tetratricopeptide repeat protein [Chitinophagaceae bacterium]|nr:tetratricopeptide repeat protein [Chitinophagaceae bacterium]